MKTEKEIKEAIKHIEDDFPNISNPESYEEPTSYVKGKYDSLKWTLL